jgi:hypothetical protein
LANSETASARFPGERNRSKMESDVSLGIVSKQYAEMMERLFIVSSCSVCHFTRWAQSLPTEQ